MGARQAPFNGPAEPLQDGLPTPRRYWAIVAIVLAIAMSVLDSSIANVALPTIAREFQAPAAVSIWVINAYQIAIVVALLPLASLGEVVGYRRVAQTGLLLFSLASLACALSSSLLTLSLARVVQGLGAAAIMSVSPALVRYTYPQRMLGRAMGINALAVAISAALGPSLAAAVLALAHWPWLFAINVPIGLVTLLIALRALPATQRIRRPLNAVSVALNVAAFALLICGLQAFAHPEAAALAAAQLLGGVVLLGTLVRHELHRPAPLIPFDLLRNPLFSLSLATSVGSFMAQMASLVSLPFELQRLGNDAVATGLLITPWPLGVACTAPLAGRLADRYPAGLLGGVGLLLLAAGLFLLAGLPEHAGRIAVIWRMALCGVGFGLFQAPNNRALMSAAPRTRSGAVGGMLSLARLLGQTLGAVSVALLLRADPEAGSHRALWWAGGLAAAAMLASLRRLRVAPAQGDAATSPRYSSNGPSSGGPP